MIELLYSSNLSTVTLKILTWISFVISLMNVLFLIFHTYLNSVFLAPIDFIPISLLDIYDGKTNVVLFLYRFFINISSFGIYVASDIIYVVLIAILLFIFCAILFYMRVMTVLHVSFVGAYFELSPFFGFPFEILLQFYYYRKWGLIISLLVAVHILFIIILKIVNYFIKKETLKIFRVLIHRNEEEEVEAELKGNHPNEAEIPSFASGNIVSGLRIMSSYYGDPQFFTRFALVQHRSGVRASPMLEIIRFLAIFPSKRIEMLKELKSLKSNSNYNRFMIYFFSKVLYSLVNPCSKQNKETLDFYQRSFIIHNHLYWTARSKKEFFNSVAEACSTAYYFIELKEEIMMLISRFPFDPSLYRRFGDFLLLASGDYENSCFIKKFADSIESKEVILTDNLIHRYINVNPRILRYLNEDEYKMSSVNDQTIIRDKILHSGLTTFFTSTYKTSTNCNNTNSNNNNYNRRRKKANLSTNSSPTNTNNSNMNTNESINSDYSINSDLTPSPLTTVSSNASVPDSNLANNNECENDDSLIIERPVASFILPSNRFIPFLPFINNILVSLLIVTFLYRIIPLENKVLSNFSAISAQRPQLLRLFVDMGNSILFPFSFSYQEISIQSFKDNNELKYIDLNSLFFPNYPENSFCSQTTKIPNKSNSNDNICSDYQNSSSFIFTNKSKLQNKDKIFITKSGNNTQNCQAEYSSMFSIVIDFFTEISQIKNLTNIVVPHVSKSARIVNKNQQSICDVLQLLLDGMFELPLFYMNSLKAKLNEVIKDLENLNDHIEIYDFTLTNLTIYFLIMIVFILLYSIIIFLQINLTMKDQNVAVMFLKSKERLNRLLLQKIEESWDVLTLFLSNEVIQFFQLRQCNDEIEYDDTSDALEVITNKRPNIESKSETSSIDEFEENYEEVIANRSEKEADMTRLFTLTAPFLSEFGQNIIMSNHQSTKECQLSDVSFSSSSKKREQGEIENNEGEIESPKQNLDLTTLIDHAVFDTKSSTKHSWITPYIFIISPWLILSLSMCLLIYPVVSHTEIERELASTALSEGRQLFACFELVQATSEYLFNKRKNVTKFEEIDATLRGFTSTLSITSYSSQISEYYTREQCMQLLGITCTSISNLVHEVIDDGEIDTPRLTLLFMPAFIHFGRSVLEELFFPDSEYVDEISMISETSFAVVICMIVLCYLIGTFRASIFDTVEGFNSLYHFPVNLVSDCACEEDNFTSFLLSNDENEIKVKMKRLCGQNETVKKLPSTVISIASLIKNDEIYSISDNVEAIFNRPSTSFIGQKLNECFPIVPSENEQLKNGQQRQFFMPDLTKKVFHSTTQKENSWLNLTLMVEFNDRFGSKKSYKEDSITEKLMHFVPTFFAKSVGSIGVQKFEYNGPIVLFLRFDSTLQATLLEQYFSIINNSVMNFTSMKVIFAEGSSFIFSTVKQVNPILPFLFARDLIEESKYPKRGKPTNGTFSILLEKVDNLTAEINQEDDEPFLETSLEKVELKLKEKILYEMERDQICFEFEFEHILPGISKNGNRCTKIVDGIGSDLVYLSFSQYLTNIKYLM